MPPLTGLRLLTTWAPDALVTLPVALLLAYGLLLVRARRADGPRWSPWRTISWVAGVLVLTWSVAGAPAAYRGSLEWMGALSAGLTSAVVPLGLALGDPLRLWERVGGAEVAWVRGRIARVVMFPLFASVLSAAVITTALTSGWFTAARTQTGPWWVLQVVLLVVGVLVTLPLLSAELLPDWCGPGLRTAFAFADGLLDAVPGLVVLAAGDSTTGQTLLATAEAVGLPMIFAVLLQWVKADEAQARVEDARLDRLEAQARVGRATDPPTTEPASPVAPVPGPSPDRPWWESDPRFAGRYRTPGRR